MTDAAGPLKDFKATRKFFVGIDSDGCVFDSRPEVTDAADKTDPSTYAVWTRTLRIHSGARHMDFCVRSNDILSMVLRQGIGVLGGVDAERAGAEVAEAEGGAVIAVVGICSQTAGVVAF